MSLLRSKPLLISFVLLAAVGLLVTQVSAQEQITAEYVIQPGDTLSKIATRFAIDVADLSEANNITNPNQLFVGDVLVLPGVDWVRGRLDVIKVPVGENFKSLRRRYQLDPVTFGRVAGVVTPSQVYAGYPVMIPSESGEELNAARAAISGGESMLMMAARTGTNPWAVSGANQVDGLWQAMRSDVLLLPGTNQPGPGALPSPLTIEVSHGNFVQGKTTVIEIGAGGAQLELAGELIGRQLHFFDNGDGVVALQGVHAMTEPGPYPLTITGTVGGDEFSFSQLVRVESGGYDRESFSVDPNYLNPTVDEAESAFIASLTAAATPEKLWEAYFTKPTPFDIFVNSYFGTRRSYNNGEFTSFHAGLDFGGGTGTDVICPANGRVVFAGSLEIRGNATIIDHGWGVYTGYFHQSEIYVQEGDLVQENQIIGVVGNTGRSTGAHLHWEVWAGGVQVEPWDWLVEQFP